MGFYQIKIKEDDVYKTSFRVLSSTYVFKRMPFGLTIAYYTFKVALGNILNDLSNTFSNIDDILIASEDIKAHYSDLKAVFNHLNTYNSEINFEKCEFPKIVFCF
ncbi:Retrovirus-related Pol polyprotein from transposon opus [Dictyocoela muelleri]|nr:Retrovirus-related Pol polyprotein from transposon opus [Dictyocoela muelleri]